MQRSPYWLPTGRLLGQARHIHLAPLRQQQRPWYWRRGHHQHVGQRALAAHQQPLIDAEAMLFVDHRQRQVVIFDAVLEQRMRADHHAHAAVLQPAQQRSTRPPLHAAGQDRHRFRRQPRQRAMVLLRQHFGGRHDRSLLAGFHRTQHRQQRHDRLARADIALQQPQHASVGSQVAIDLRERLMLGRGQRVAEPGKCLGAQAAIADQLAAEPGTYPPT